MLILKQELQKGSAIISSVALLVCSFCDGAHFYKNNFLLTTYYLPEMKEFGPSIANININS